MPTPIQVQVDTEDGNTETVVLDLDLNTLSMREAVRLEEALGTETLDALMKGTLNGAAERPSTIRALIYTKLKTLRPDVALDGFDLDLGDLAVSLGAAVDDPKDSGPES